MAASRADAAMTSSIRRRRGRVFVAFVAGATSPLLRAVIRQAGSARNYKGTGTTIRSGQHLAGRAYTLLLLALSLPRLDKRIRVANAAN